MITDIFQHEKFFNFNDFACLVNEYSPIDFSSMVNSKAEILVDYFFADPKDYILNGYMFREAPIDVGADTKKGDLKYFEYLMHSSSFLPITRSEILETLETTETGISFVKLQSELDWVSTDGWKPQLYNLCKVFDLRFEDLTWLATNIKLKDRVYNEAEIIRLRNRRVVYNLNMKQMCIIIGNLNTLQYYRTKIVRDFPKTFLLSTILSSNPIRIIFGDNFDNIKTFQCNICAVNILTKIHAKISEYEAGQYLKLIQELSNGGRSNKFNVDLLAENSTTMLRVLKILDTIDSDRLILQPDLLITN